METINYEDLHFTDSNPNNIYNSGYYGKIKKCTFNNKIYAYKEFKNEKYLISKKRKLSNLSEITIPGLIVPKYWVKKDKSTNAYLTIFEDKDNISSLSKENFEQKFKTLKNAKELILTMHKEGIIHSDLHSGNILFKNKICSIIDFDNCTFKTYWTFKNDANDYCRNFINVYGISPELDIFLFNLLTYEILNDVKYYTLRKNISENKYGIFDNKEGIRICKSLFLDDKYPNKDFLIDTIDETSFTI